MNDCLSQMLPTIANKQGSGQPGFHKPEIQLADLPVVYISSFFLWDSLESSQNFNFISHINKIVPSIHMIEQARKCRQYIFKYIPSYLCIHTIVSNSALEIICILHFILLMYIYKHMEKFKLHISDCKPRAT